MAILPVSLTAQESAGAILHSSGVGVQVNKNPAPASIALYRNDLVETQRAAAARIEITGSSADISQETMVQFESEELVLDHGSLSVNTSRGLRVRVGCVTVVPVNQADWTHYEVADVDGKVTVWARKSDVYIDAKSRNVQPAKQSAQSKSERSIVRESEQKSRDEKCAAAEGRRSAAAAGPGVLSSPWAIAAGAGGAAGIACWGLCHNDEPVSPSSP
jgi:hypothetical protein